MKVEIFDVDHGACALITTASNQHVLLDCGHRSGTQNTMRGLLGAAALTVPAASATGLAGLAALGGTNRLLQGLAVPPDAGWRPSVELANRGIETIDRLLISNFDEDHLSDLANIHGKIYIAEIAGNPTVSPQNIRAMKPLGIGRGTAALLDLLETKQHTFRPRQINGADLYSIWVLRGFNGIVDANNLSVVTFVRWHNLHMIFPGDIEAPAWELMLANNDFLSRLRQVNVFVASHHGRENGYHPEVFRNGRCSPQVVVISDKPIVHGTQEGMAATYGALAACRT